VSASGRRQALLERSGGLSGTQGLAHHHRPLLNACRRIANPHLTPATPEPLATGPTRRALTPADRPPRAPPVVQPTSISAPKADHSFAITVSGPHELGDE